ncbi:MAG: M23 family metallopeptidase [Bacteroidales bacterium]|nr:M23 family metallopeptidase [Bacteroidales bacterium]
MADNRYELDLRNFDIRKAGHDISRAVWKAVRFILTVVSLTVVGYVLFALFYSTDEEKHLKEENSRYEALYPGLPAKLDKIGEDLERLSRKDDIIYKDIFHSDPPSADPMSSLSIFFGSDSIPDAKLVFYTAEKAERLAAEAAGVDSLFRKIASALSSPGLEMPPMALPLDSISYTQTGAGTGTKINPFYTTEASHQGVDFIVAQGTPVKAAADGVVSSVQRSRKGDGNTVTIKHKGGYRTRYAHLQDISVSQGQSVRKGRVIATAGMSGNSYAPHLHYEVWRDSTLLDPLNYIFASVSPEEYSNMVYMARHTRQTMD